MNKALRTSAIFLVSAVILFSSFISVAQTTVTIGTGTVTAYKYPLNTYYKTCKSQILYLGSEVGVSGSISKIQFNIQTAGGPQTCLNFTIKMKEVSETNWNSATDFIDMTSATTVYGPTTENNIGGSTGWNEFTLSAPFTFNQSNNLAVEISYGQNSSYAIKTYVYCTDQISNYRVLYGYQDVAPPVSYSGKHYYRPNITITIGSSCTAPSSQATAFTYNSIAQTTMTLGWTRGTPSGGDAVLVIAKAGSAPTDPVSGTSYTGVAAYGSGTAVGGGYAIYNGTGTSVPITNLTAGTAYSFAAYEYNNTGTCYNLTELTGNATTLKNTPSTQAYTITFSDVVCASMTVNWTNGNGDKRVVKINTSNNFTAPADGTDPSANSAYGGSGEQVVYNGSGSTIGITGLTASITYWFRVYEYNNTGANTKYLTSIAADNPKSQSTLTSCSMTWLGNTTIWETGTNWNPAGPPSSIYDVVIPAVPSGGDQPTIAGNAVCGSITNNGTITMNHSSYDLSIYGNYSGSGTFAGFNNSSVYFKGSSNITISGSPTFPILWIQKNAVTNTVTANSSITSSGLYLRKGTLDMGGSSGYDLTTTSYSPAIGLDVTSDGKLYVHDANTLVQIQGAGNHLTIYKGGTLDIDAGELKITNALFNIDGGTLDMSGGIIRQQTWEGTEGYGSQWGGTNGCNITISGGDIYFENSHFTIGATTFVNITGGTIHCANSMWTSTSANWNPSAGTVEMYGSVYDGQLYNSDDENSWLWDLNITKSAPKKVYHGGPATTAYDDIVVKNNLYIANSSTLSAKQGIAANYQGKIMVYNNWDNNNGGTYEEESGKVTFKGVQNGTIYSPAGGETFYKLVINKSNKAYTVNLTDNITATYRLTLTTGTITTGVYQVYLSSDWDDNLDDDQGGGTSSIFANSWVYGNLKRAIDNPSSAGDTYWFPVGISNRSNPTVLIVGASKLSGISDITCYFKPTPTTPNLNFPSNLTEGGQTYLGVSEEGVWVFNPAGTMAGNYNLKCYFSGFSGLEDGKFSILSRPADLNNGTNWQLIGTPSNTTVASGYAYRVNCTSFSEKGIGRTPGVLPIELLSFTSECDNQKIKLLWSTASETNNDYFTIEKSKDLQTWNIVATVNGAGNSNNYIYYSAEDNEPYSGNSYYKLKQTDYDGAFTYSEIIYSSSCDNTSFEYISVYPNPAYDHLNCDIFSEENTVIDINITNTLGQSVITKKVDIKKGANSFSINVSKLMSATYYFEIKTVNGLFKYGKQILVR